MTLPFAPLPIQNAALREQVRTAFGFGLPAPTDSHTICIDEYITVPALSDQTITISLAELQTRRYSVMDRYEVRPS